MEKQKKIKFLKYMNNGQRYAIDCRNVRWTITKIWIGEGRQKSSRYECLSELNEEFYAESYPDAYEKIKNKSIN